MGATSNTTDQIQASQTDQMSSVIQEHSMITTRAEATIQWPPKYDLFGVRVSAVTYDQACDAILSAARQREQAVVSAFAVHALIEAANERALAAKVNRFAIITPDGQPVRWALNWLHGVRLKQRVYGPHLMWRLCQRAAEEGVSIYLYGSMPETLAALEANLLKAFPALVIAGTESPPFRSLSPEEDAAMVDRVNASGAGLFFIGLGCPKQDYFAADHADRIQAVQLCVGAAFDFHAGTKATAPEWMQRRGLEWLFRLYHEPRRLWKRYLVTNSIYLRKLAAQFIRQRVLRWPSGSEGKTTRRVAVSTQNDKAGSVETDLTTSI
jgi:N-acetylglucosaminyldiphosphoundecaprenol N-acetyl-beta-D-mannosaminyltransferase